MSHSTAEPIQIADRWEIDADVALYWGGTLDLLNQMPAEVAQLVITSPPYNLDKPYERDRKLSLEEYVADQQEVIDECVRILRPGGSICWQVGNHVGKGEIYPLDILLYPLFKRHEDLKLRNRVVWHFEHGMHCTKRLSGRHETILWFTKGADYTFNLDPLRVPQKYPGKKHYSGPKVGTYSGNPKGKNPGDVWIFPNVKANHVEKTIHPCQFPVELVERFVLSVTAPGDIVFDPFMGVGSAAVAAVMHGRRVVGADIVSEYVQIARERVVLASTGSLKTRPMGRDVHRPNPNSPLARRDDLKQDLPRRTNGTRSPAQGLVIARRVLECGDRHEDSDQPQFIDTKFPRQSSMLDEIPPR
jgi:adenine-specific DNA-methyltransferase